MSKKIGVFCFIFCVTLIAVYFSATKITAYESSSQGKFVVPVPHVVLPETIQYKENTAVYTPFPSYTLPEGTEFRTINQLNYPITPVLQNSGFWETIAQVHPDRQIVPTDQKIAQNINGGQARVPQFETPSVENMPARADVEPIYLTKIETAKHPIQLVSGYSDNDTTEETPETPAGSIVFLKSQHSPKNNSDIIPLQLQESLLANDFNTNQSSTWLGRESLWIRPVSYTESTAPAPLNLMPQKTGYQQAQYQQCGLFGSTQPQANYNSATGLTGVWDAYLGAAATQQPVPMQSAQYNSLAQLGGMMPMMAGQGMTQNMPQGMAMPMQASMMQMPNQGYGMPMQPMMQQPAQMSVGGIPQQTIGYILLYPQAAQAGVNMQLTLAGQPENQGENAEAEGETSAQNPTGPQMQAVFVPVSQMPNYPSNQAYQPAMMQAQMPNPATMDMNPAMMNPYMMNPYMMNPAMMGGMNPYMMNPMMNPMMGMGGMMPPIIIQMPSDNSKPRRQGLFARRRAARDDSQNRYQQASSSLGSLFAQQPEYMPAKMAYPYGYFGATSSPYQTGNFGGYHDMRMQVVQYPGNM